MPLRTRSSVLKAIFIFPSLLTTSISYATLQTRDMDSDGMPDFWEMAYGLNTFDPLDKQLGSSYVVLPGEMIPQSALPESIAVH